MSRRTKNDTTAWRSTPLGLQVYETAKAEAQAKADATGADHGLEFNDLFREVRVWRLPTKPYRFGHELRCEVVSCSHWDRIVSGHGGKA